MFDIGWTELLVIGVVALIVVGPKDLPGMFRTLGRFTAKARGMAREFSRAMEDAADDAGVKDIAGDLKKATSAKNMGLDTLKDAATKFEDWDPTKKTSSSKRGPATQALSEERAEMARKIQESTAKRANERIAAEAEKDSGTKAPKKPATKKPSAKKPATKKPATKKPAAKAAPKPASAGKATPKQTTARKPAAKKKTKPAAKASE